MRAPLSVCVIAYNEEHRLAPCLESVAWADERLVVVDERTRDATEAIARQLGARAVRHPYEGNVQQKNFALSQAKHDWVLALDADEAVSPALARELYELLARDEALADGYEINRITHHLGRWIRHGDYHPDWQLRLFRRARGSWRGLNPHGRVWVEGRVGRLRGSLEHRSYTGLADQVDRIQSFSGIQARALYAAGRRARAADLFLRPPARFLRAYLWKQGFRDGLPGLVVAVATAFHVFLKYAKLWELARQGARGGSHDTARAQAPPPADSAD